MVVASDVVGEFLDGAEQTHGVESRQVGRGSDMNLPDRERHSAYSASMLGRILAFKSNVLDVHPEW